MIIHKNKIFEEIETDFYNTWKELTVTEKEPLLAWKKGKITLEQWEDIKNICEYTNDKFKSECLIRLYFNSKEDKWAMLMHPQTMSGMTVNDTLDTELILSLGDGWAEAGSVHHHCTAGAFQSSTDESDEMQASGLHITIGKVGNNQYEIHARFREGNSFTDPNLATFFELPNWLTNDVPADFRYSIFEHLISSKGNPDLSKDDWISKCKERVPLHNQWSNQSVIRYNGYGHSTKTVRAEPVKPIDTKESDHYHTSNDLDDLNEKQEANLIQQCWNVQQKIMYEVVDNLCSEFELTCDDLLDVIDSPLKEFNDSAVMTTVWQAIRDSISQVNQANLTDLRKFISEERADLELVIWVNDEARAEAEAELKDYNGGYEYYGA
jgi:hypothetical protein